VAEVVTGANPPHLYEIELDVWSIPTTCCSSVWSLQAWACILQYMLKASNVQSPNSFWVCCLSLCTFLFRVTATHRVHYGCNLPVPEIWLLLWWPPTVLLFFSDSMYHWLNLSTSIYLNGTTKSCTEHILPRIGPVKSLYLSSFYLWPEIFPRKGNQHDTIILSNAQCKLHSLIVWYLSSISSSMNTLANASFQVKLKF
jgi:hypothetical protein